MEFKKENFIFILSLGLTGCASMIGGTQQTVSVETKNVEGADCTLSNNKGIWYIKNTPGSVVVNRSFSDMHIKCEKPGYEVAQKSIASSTRPIVFGNIVFYIAGILGAAVDIADGAAYDYPVPNSIEMRKV